MKYWILAFLLTFSLWNGPHVIAQNVSAKQMANVNIDDLSDEQILDYWERAQKEGYNMEQLEVLAKARGISEVQIAKLKRRIRALDMEDTEEETEKDLMAEEDTELGAFGLDGTEEDMEEEESDLFGYDFFNNPTISFTPNLNLATPVNYQLGPGDEILIDIWGAAESNYQLEVGREGAIHIENIGPVYVSGLTVAKAKTKITSYLKKIYSGIGASNDSYNKIHADISLAGVRTVQVNIIGEVKVPGTYSLSAMSTVLNALYAAGGPSENGTFRTIKLIREGKPYKEFDIYKYLIEGSEEGNELLRDQDVIIIKPYENKIIVAGEVKRPGVYEVKEGESVKDLVDYFSGFTANAYKNRLLLERVNGLQKEVHEIDLKNQPQFLLHDGDSINVGRVIDRYENRVSINGAVYREGNYQLTEGLTLAELIEKAEGIKEDAFLDRGIIYRTVDGVREEVVPFSVQNILDKTSNVVLKREDSIQVYGKESLREAYTVSIDGAVNNPIEIVYREKMSIEDFIAIAGGYKEGADAAVIDVARRVIDSSFTTLSKNIKRSSTVNLEVNSSETFYLEPFDKVSVRYLKGYAKKIQATIRGEVSYPGNYVITDKDERISDLLEKSGGLSPFAYVKGATLIRRVVTSSDKEQLKMLKELIVKDSMSVDVASKNEFMIGIDLEKILDEKGKNSKYDLTLKAGDILVIPSQKQTVAVQGEILMPTLIGFEKSKSLKDYINNSGGFTENAKKRKTYVVYANGEVKSTKSFLGIRNYPKIEPGAIILVPKSEPKKKVTLSEFIGLSSALLSLALLIQSL